MEVKFEFLDLIFGICHCFTKSFDAYTGAKFLILVQIDQLCQTWRINIRNSELNYKDVLKEIRISLVYLSILDKRKIFGSAVGKNM